VEEGALSGSLNVFLHAINHAVNRHELLSDTAVVAIKAWETLLRLLSERYDQRAHQAALLIVKSICSVVVRKLDRLIAAFK